jgi:hypothetical protein
VRAFVAACAALAACRTAAPASEAELTDLDRNMIAHLTGVEDRGPITFHFDPAASTREELEVEFEANLADERELEEKLGVAYRGRIQMFLYASREAMEKLTGEGAVAFSTGTCSVHQPIGFRGVHELTHLFAVQFPRGPHGSTDLFVTEGLATALAESDQNVPIRSWAAVYRRARRLPEIGELRKTFPEGSPPGVHPYHVAAAFVAYLLERFGLERVKLWYVNSTEAYLAFGVTLPELESDWLAWLDATEVAPEHARHVKEKLGIPTEPMPEVYRTARGTPLFDGHSLAGLDAEDTSRWSVRDGVLVGTNDGAWTRLSSGAESGDHVGVRARLRLVEGNAVQLFLNRGKERMNEAIFTVQSAFMTSGEGYRGAREYKLEPGRWIEIVFVNQGGRGRLFVDGIGVFDDEDGLRTTPGRLGMGVERGTVEVSELVRFDPDT